ncbi:MAG: GNAT family N-acetyltransferase, partial [Angelakisella sp.]
MEFKKIELSDQDWMNEKLAESDFRGSEYCFSNSYNWRNVYGVHVGQTHGMLVIQCTKPTVTYAYPAGKGDLKGAVQELIDHAGKSAVPLMI